MQLYARWALPVYPDLKAQSQEKGVKTSYKNKKKDRAPIQSNSWIVKNQVHHNIAPLSIQLRSYS